LFSIFLEIKNLQNLQNNHTKVVWFRVFGTKIKHRNQEDVNAYFQTNVTKDSSTKKCNKPKKKPMIQNLYSIVEVHARKPRSNSIIFINLCILYSFSKCNGLCKI
jgi:hypothetical protein